MLWGSYNSHLLALHEHELRHKILTQAQQFPKNGEKHDALSAWDRVLRANVLRKAHQWHPIDLSLHHVSLRVRASAK